jgi:hypothetical protein
VAHCVSSSTAHRALSFAVACPVWEARWILIVDRSNEIMFAASRNRCASSSIWSPVAMWSAILRNRTSNAFTLNVPAGLWPA